MKIAASDLALQTKHLARTWQESSESLRAWRGQRPDFEGQRGNPTTISPMARQALAREAAVPPVPTSTSASCGEANAIESACEAAENDPYIVLIKRMLELLTGEEVRTIDLEEFSAGIRQVESQSATAGVAATTAGQAGWGVEYDYHAIREEFEQTTFSAEGTIRTADGQEITFKLDVEMTRHYREETNVSLRAGDTVRKDPLVVNFGGTAAQLASHAGQRFLFDLDGDGEAELLPLFASGSGYLALDLDGNGRVDSGRDLFGPRTGRGFGELAAHDLDGNGWIDADDPIFGKLFVWTPDAEGAGALRSLASLGVGAIALAHVATPFALRGPDNADLGFVKNTGLYLDREGRAGSLQEIDLTV